jgi:hypothetical protein
MTLSTKIGIGFVVAGFLVGFFDRQIFGRGPSAARLVVILGLGVACLVTMFLLGRRGRRRG